MPPISAPKKKNQNINTEVTQLKGEGGENVHLRNTNPKTEKLFGFSDLIQKLELELWGSVSAIQYVLKNISN